MIGHYGSLTVVCGPMFAGKTTEILRRVLWAKSGQEREVVVLKPAFDDRYAESEIVSHDGLRATAENVTALPDLMARFSAASRFTPPLVLLDEVQFFTDPYVVGDVEEWVRALLRQGVDVVAGGLDMDVNGQPFRVTGTLAAMADEVIKATAFCTVCGRPASKTYLKAPEAAREDGEPFVALGGSDQFEARCNRHFLRPDPEGLKLAREALDRMEEQFVQVSEEILEALSSDIDEAFASIKGARHEG